MTSSEIIMSHTKHVDIKYEYVNEYVKDGEVKIILVKFAKNDSDILKKDLSAELHEKHLKEMCYSCCFNIKN